MSTSALFPPDHYPSHHLSPPSEQLCYVHCTFCDTALAVSVPYSSLFRSSVMVRCGHCTNLLSLPIRLPNLPNNHQLGNTLFSPQNLLEDTRTSPSNMLINQSNPNGSLIPVPGFDELPKPPLTNRPPEKRQRVPSAYNRFIKEEIQRIKAGNPDISHREAFSAAAKNWAHFPHIHFGLMPADQSVKKTNVCQQEGDGYLGGGGGVANVGLAPY